MRPDIVVLLELLVFWFGVGCGALWERRQWLQRMNQMQCMSWDEYKAKYGDKTKGG